MDNIVGSMTEVASHDEVYMVSLVKDDDGVKVVASCIKDRHGVVLEPDKVLFKLYNSPYKYFTIGRK